MNRCVFIGRLCADPEVRWTQGSPSMAIAKFTLAVDRRIKKEGEQSADFINCVAFGKTAEFAEKYLSKGTKIALEGRWQTGSYQNKDGQKIYTNECMVDAVEFAESKKTEGQTPANEGEFMNLPTDISEDDLPFN